MRRSYHVEVSCFGADIWTVDQSFDTFELARTRALALRGCRAHLVPGDWIKIAHGGLTVWGPCMASDVPWNGKES